MSRIPVQLYPSCEGQHCELCSQTSISPLSFNPQLTHTGPAAQNSGLCLWKGSSVGNLYNCTGGNLWGFWIFRTPFEAIPALLQLVFNSIAKSSSCPRRGETKNLKEQSSLLILKQKSCTSDEGMTDQTEKTLNPKFNPSIKEKISVISPTLWICWATLWTFYWN